MTNPILNNSDQEIRTSRLINSPLEIFWEFWTNPEHLKNWWVPSGFSYSIYKVDIIPNEEWNLILNGPNGKNYNNKSIFKEVVKFNKFFYQNITVPRFLPTNKFGAQDPKRGYTGIYFCIQ